MKLKLYEYAGCSTCQKAKKFLNQKKIAVEVIPIVDQPPSLTELKSMLAHQGNDLKKLFNTSGQLYREMKISDRWESLTEASALKLLSQNGKLIKRPFLLDTSKEARLGLVGFKEAEWNEQL